MLTEGELLDRARAGDNAAKAELCRRYWTLVGRFFTSKVEEHTEDLRQQTFERLLVALDRYEGRSSLRSFVLGIAHRVLLEFLRRKYRDAHEQLEDLSIADMGFRASSLFARKEDERRTLHALRRIPMGFQVVLELTHWEGLSDTEIAEVLDMPANTVRSRRTRARDRLRAELTRADEGDGSPPVLTETPADFDAWARRIGQEIWSTQGDAKPRE